MNCKVIPIFRIFDYEKALEFYIDWLGFKINWEDKKEGAPVYMEIVLEDIILHLSEQKDDACPGAKVFIESSSGLFDLHAKLITKDYNYNKPGIEKASWNATTMEVTDPFGNKLLFSEALPSSLSD